MASDKLTKLKKAAEEKKAQKSKAQKPESRPPPARPKAEAKPSPEKKAIEKPSLKPVPEAKPKQAKPAPEPKAPPPPSTKKVVQDGPAEKPPPPSALIFREIIEAVKKDSRVKDIDAAARVVSAARGRMEEIERKEKSVKDIVDEEIRKIIPS